MSNDTKTRQAQSAHVIREIAVSRILRAAMISAARRHEAPKDSRLHSALEELALRLDEWADHER